MVLILSELDGRAIEDQRVCQGEGHFLLLENLRCFIVSERFDVALNLPCLHVASPFWLRTIPNH